MPGVAGVSRTVYFPQHGRPVTHPIHLAKACGTGILPGLDSGVENGLVWAAARTMGFMSKPKTEVREFTVVNKLGMHARPSSLFVQTASKFGAEIKVRREKQVIDGKSILGLLMLAAGQGSQLIVSAQGEDAVEALNALEKLISSKFGEE